MSQHASSAHKELGIYSTIFWTGFLAGTLDGIAAIVQFMLTSGKNPENVFRYIASGIFGKEAYSESGMILSGLLFHYVFAYIFTGLLFAVYPYLKFIWKWPVVIGLVYGLIIWLIMNLLVIPSSNAAIIPFKFPSSLVGVGILMLLVGLPIALIVHKYYSRRISKQFSFS